MMKTAIMGWRGREIEKGGSNWHLMELKPKFGVSVPSRLTAAHRDKELGSRLCEHASSIAMRANRLDSCSKRSLLITFVPLIWKGWKAVYKSQMLYLSLHKCVDNIEEWTRAFFLFARRRSKSSGSLAILAVTAAAPSFV